MKNPVHDFGYNSRVIEMTISRHSEPEAPTVHRRLILTIEAGVTHRRFAFINPQPLASLSAMMEAWAFKILDRNREGESFVEFGRFWIEYMDDEDSAPRRIQADRFEELREDAM